MERVIRVCVAIMSASLACASPAVGPDTTGRAVAETKNCNDAEGASLVMGAMTDQEISALEAQVSAPSAYEVKLAAESEYVLEGWIRVEIGVGAPARAWTAKRSFDVVIRDDQGRVALRVRPHADGIAHSGFSRIDQTELTDYVLSTESSPGVFALLLPSDCMSPGGEYTIVARLLHNDALAPSASATFRVRAPSTADTRMRAELGIPAYLEDPTHYALFGDVRPALSLPLAGVGSDVPWRYAILLAHLYAGATDPANIPPEELARLAGGAYALSAPRLFARLPSGSPAHEFFARDRAERLGAGPGAR